jgi:hypothetical protein
VIRGIEVIGDAATKARLADPDFARSTRKFPGI